MSPNSNHIFDHCGYLPRARGDVSTNSDATEHVDAICPTHVCAPHVKNRTNEFLVISQLPMTEVTGFKFQKESDPMQLINELSWLWKEIGIIALVSAMVLIAAFKLHKEEYKIEIVCIILIVTVLICSIAMILCARVPMLI